MVLSLGLSGYQGRMRIREDFTDRRSSRVIGQTYARNLVTGKVSRPSNVTALCGDQIDRVSIDENHGRPPYRTDGPLCLYRLLRPTYPSPAVSVMSRKLPVGRTLFIDGVQTTVKASDDWRLCYDGAFTKNTSGLPSSLGSAGSYRPTSFGSSHPEIDEGNLSDLGNRAYGILRPKIESANLTQSLVEIGSARPMFRTTMKGFHELWNSISGGYAGGLRTAFKHRKKGGNPWIMSPKGAADQFLNLQFGWSPALQDLVAVVQTAENLESLVADAMGNQGHWVSRRFHEDVIESEEVVYSQFGVSTNQCNPVLSSQDFIMPNSGSTVVKLQRFTEVWYEGSFKRYRPEFDPVLTRVHPALKAAEQAAVKFGLRVNPTTLYRCIPYTWLADYVGAFTSGIQRMEDMLTGEMVCRRFHLMRRSVKRYEYRVKFATRDGQSHDFVWYLESSVKRRANGTSSFGFSASPGGLTGMQYAILAALGASRGKG